MDFEWDAYKAEDNRFKHHVSFDEATEVFDDPIVLTLEDEWHSGEEDRFIAIGVTQAARLLVVSYTMRGAAVRIISARDAVARERRRYVAGE